VVAHLVTISTETEKISKWSTR